MKLFPGHLIHHPLFIFSPFETHNPKSFDFQPFLVITFTLNPVQIFLRDTTVLVIHLFSEFLYVDMDTSFFLSATEAGKACHHS